MRYLKTTATTGLFFPPNALENLVAYCDADWGTCKRTRRSVTGYCIFLDASPISWKSKKQLTISITSSETKYRSVASTVCELQWINSLMKDFSINPELPVPLHCDNQAAVYISRNVVYHERTKHLEKDCHIVRAKYKEGFVKPLHVSTKLQIADILTKPVGVSVFWFLFFKLGLVSLNMAPT